MSKHTIGKDIFSFLDYARPRKIPPYPPPGNVSTEKFTETPRDFEILKFLPTQNSRSPPFPRCMSDSVPDRDC